MLNDSHAAIDVIVIGGGPAGLAAALQMVRAGLTVTVIDNEHPRNRFADHMQSFLTRDGTSPSEMLAIARHEVAGYGVVIHNGTAIDAQRHERAKTIAVTLADGSAIIGRRLLVTTGLTDVLPAIPGLAERWGKEVIHCPFCHGYEVRNQAIGVLVTGEASLHQALLFRQWTDDLIVFAHTGAVDSAMRARLAARNVSVVDGVVRRVLHDAASKTLTGVELEDGRTIMRQILVVTPRFTANASIPATMGAEIAEAAHGSWIAVDRGGKTTVPGVYAAGNVSDPMAQVMAAAAQGAMAGGAIVMDIVNEDFDNAEASRADAHARR